VKASFHGKEAPSPVRALSRNLRKENAALNIRKRCLFVAATVLASSWALAAPPSVIEKITPHNGEPIEGVSGVEFDGQAFTVPGKPPIPRADVSTLEFKNPAAPGNAAAAAKSEDAGLTELAKSKLEQGVAMAKNYPGVSGVVLLDDGEFVLHKDGSNSYRYHFAGLVLKEEMKGWAQISFGFSEGRSRANLLYARSIKRDGSVATLSQDAMKVGSPSEDLEFFNPRYKTISGVIPGVDVGSIVEYCYEVEEYNPEDPRLFNPGFYFQGEQPVVFSRVHIEVPKDIDLKFATRHFPEPAKAQPVIEENGDAHSYTWLLEEMSPLVSEPLMPPDPDVVPMLEASVFKDYAEVYEMLKKLQENRIKQTPEIDAKVNEITQGAQSVDEKIALIYYWVQTNTRYISIKGSLGAGFSGHTAKETFDNRYGDCTDKSVLFCTMLKSAGIDADPIILHTNDSGVAVTEIPTMSGNHCITEVCLPDRNFYLDSTAQDYRYPFFRADDHGAFAMNAIRGDIKTIPVPPPSDNHRESKLEITLAENGDAEVQTLNKYNGNVEASIRSFWKHVREDDRRQRMSQYVNSISPGALLKDFSLTDLEDLAKPLEMTLNYSLPGQAIRAKDLMYLKMPTLERDYPEVALETRRHPIQYMTTEERLLDIDLSVPKGFRAKWLPPALELANPYFEFKGSYEERNGHILFHETFRRLQRIVPPEDYPTYRDALRSIAAFSKQEIFLTEKG
jgi:hypothetical protein